jgi:hypothetical protein
VNCKQGEESCRDIQGNIARWGCRAKGSWPVHFAHRCETSHHQDSSRGLPDCDAV